MNSSWAFFMMIEITIVVLIVVATAWTRGRLLVDGDPQELHPFRMDWIWLGRGLVVPAAIWFLMNVGLSFELQPFMPGIQAAKNSGGDWLFALAVVWTTGLLVIGSVWGAVTMGWVVIGADREIREELRTEYRAVCFTAFAIMILPAAILILIFGWWAIGFAALMILTPIPGYAASVVRRPKKSPGYSRALSRMKFGKYAQAEQEILKQLETAENDFDGWMMLAELHATKFNELDEAEKIVLDVCVQPGVTPSQFSIALHRLADWQINIARDPEAAARTLQHISDYLPGTHLAHMAELRRKQLPSTKDELVEREKVHAVPLPVIPGNVLEALAAKEKSVEENDAVAQVNRLSESLTRDPQNISDRERLARLLAEPLGKTDLAIEQINLLLEMGGQPDEKRVAWLTLIAGWQLQLLNDETAAMETLQKIVGEFPSTQHGFMAQRRLNLLRAEIAARKT
jgi:tetratricopeptide (TPR) repeat protein